MFFIGFVQFIRVFVCVHLCTWVLHHRHKCFYVFVFCALAMTHGTVHSPAKGTQMNTCRVKPDALANFCISVCSYTLSHAFKSVPVGLVLLCRVLGLNLTSHQPSANQSMQQQKKSAESCLQRGHANEVERFKPRTLIRSSQINEWKTLSVKIDWLRTALWVLDSCKQ